MLRTRYEAEGDRFITKRIKKPLGYQIEANRSVVVALALVAVIVTSTEPKYATTVP